MKSLLMLVAVLSLAGSSDPAPRDAAGGAAGAAGAPPVEAVAEGTCTFVVDGKSRTGGPITSLATGKLASFSVQCQTSEDNVGYTVGIAVAGASGPGSYVIATTPGISGVASYTEQGVNGAPGQLNSYRQLGDWAVTLTAADETRVAGSATLVGELGPVKMNVTLAFNVKISK